jgi:hypothetical protein
VRDGAGWFRFASYRAPTPEWVELACTECRKVVELVRSALAG